MANLSVTSTYLDKLARAQDATKENFKSSAGAVDGVGVNVWLNHGLACGPGNDAVVGVEVSRAEAIQLMIEVATDLAANLRAAAKAYDGTDQDAAQNLDKQVLPG
ncbi:ESX-1 secretion-associated protein [Mycobacterium sp. 4858]|uniref:ESX-1 secretion-associated protein n=1 Tax=Mycobacterium sp. 4858 TaxID=2057185 RepID=UPI000C82D179|nr:ESX-1 secretion-associated protein [Mycobacterium sp. 4858]